MDKEITERNLGTDQITNDMLFIQRYTELTNILVGTTRDVFGMTRKFDGTNYKITSPLICCLEKHLMHIGGALNLERRGPEALVLEGSREELDLL